VPADLSVFGKGHRLDGRHPASPEGKIDKSGGSRRHVGGGSSRRLSRGSAVVPGARPYKPCLWAVERLFFRRCQLSAPCVSRSFKGADCVYSFFIFARRLPALLTNFSPAASFVVFRRTLQAVSLGTWKPITVNQRKSGRVLSC
jgi:hypothetical protein